MTENTRGTGIKLRVICILIIRIKIIKKTTTSGENKFVECVFQIFLIEVKL